jgi:uncharacterized protein (DUF885 family)
MDAGVALMRLRLLTLSLLAVLGATGCSQEAPTPGPGQSDLAPGTLGSAQADTNAAELHALFAEYWEQHLERNPLAATFQGDHRYNDRLPDQQSAEARADTLAFQRRWLQRIEAIAPDSLPESARLSRETFVRDMRITIEGERFPGWMQPLNQFNSFPNQFAMLGSGSGAQPFATVQDYDNWLARAGNIPAFTTRAMANMREGMRAGMVQPRALMDKVLPQLDALIKDDPEQTLFWQPIANMPDSFSAAERERLHAAYRQLISEQLMPSYIELRAFVADEYLRSARISHGLGALPGGAAWYAYNVRRITTTDLTADQIHRIGLEEVARIHAQMREVIADVGFEGSLHQLFAHMSSAPQFEFESEEALLTAYRALEQRTNERVDELFALTPRAAFEIRPVEAFRAASAAGGSYQRPSEDGSRPGIFYVNTYDLPGRKVWAMESLFLHEAIPGHHFQIALQQEQADLPAFRRFGGSTAFVEGWGLYSESLGRELGLYTDPYQYFGRLEAELWRSIRLVVDTGLHSRGWTREQVIGYMKANSSTSNTRAVAETERYMAIPGQALAYKVGELKILKLRNRAQLALGERFDIREFHAEVLRHGSLPLDVLEGQIESWIKAQEPT